MDGMLIHTSDVKVSTLDPSFSKGEKCIYLAEKIIPDLGKFVYVFPEEYLLASHRSNKRPTQGFFNHQRHRFNEYHYRSQPLGEEIQIFDPINVKRFAVAVIEMYCSTKGRLDTLLNGEIMSREMINLQPSK